MGTLLEDLRYGLRMLRKSPGFALTALFTLALGIGANTALFSVVNGVLLNPLPYPHPERLVALHESKPNFERGSISFPNFLDWQKENRTFSAMAVTRGSGFGLTGRGDAEQINGQFISANYFRVLGVKPVIGRDFEPEEDQRGGAPAVLISAGFWQRRFGASPEALGKSITLDGIDYTILGVIPASFHLPAGGAATPEVYVPVTHWSNNLLLERSAGLGIHGIGRFKAGVTIGQARADMARVTAALAAAYPKEDKGIGAALVPLHEQMTGRVRPLLLVLLAGVAFVLLIACVNVANLMLARASGRTREFAVRTALGAGRMRLMRQLLTESLLLSSAGGALGLLLAAWGTRAALAALPTALPRAEEIGLDTHVLAFTLAVSLLAGVLFGLAPALRAAAADVQGSLKETGRGASAMRHRAQDVLVVAEIALALVLLIGAGLMIRTMARLWTTDPGFNPHDVLTLNVSMPPAMMQATPATIRASLREIEREIEAVPGVEAASLSWGALPMNGDDERLFWREGQPKPANENDMSWTLDYIVDPHYLQVMRVPLRRGRFLTPMDDERSPLAIVVDDVFARTYFPREDPIGKRIHLASTAAPAQIVGIVGHVKQWGLDSDDREALRAQMYLSLMQLPDATMTQVASGVGVVVRSRGPRPGLFDSIRRALQRLSHEQIVYGAQSMDEIISISLARHRFSMILLDAFAAVALLLAAMGIYGVTSYMAGRRTHEIGIRMALGADKPHILRLVVGPGGKLALIGVALGLAAAFGLTRLMASLLYGVGATDSAVFGCVAVLMVLVTLAACYAPARRAARVDPLVALRYE